MKKPIPKKSSSILKTPQSLIHIKHNMTILQYKYWIIFLHHIKDQVLNKVAPDKHGYHYISFDEITNFLGYTPKKSEVYTDLKRLRNYEVEYNVLEKDGEKAKVVEGFLRAASVSSKRIGYVLPPIFVDAILELDGAKNIFQLLNWEIFNSFSGKYEAIIYKLCKDYVGVNTTPYMTVEEYRSYIGLKDGEYPNMRDLNKRCISNPIKAINKSEISDITISVVYEKKGRKTIGLRFLVEQKKQTTLPFPEFEPNPAFLFAKINIPISRQNHYLEKYEPDQVQAIIDRANEYADQVKQKGKKLNLEGIYNKAFNEGWGVENWEALKKAEEEKKKQQQAEAKAKAKKQREEEIKAKKKEEQKRKIVTAFEKLPDEEKNERIQAIIAENDGFFASMMQEKYQKTGFDIINEPMFRANYFEKYGE